MNLLRIYVNNVVSHLIWAFHTVKSVTTISGLLILGPHRINRREMSREIKEGVVIGDIHFYECNESNEHMCSKCGAQTGKCCSLCKKCYKYMTKDCATVRIEGDGVLFPRTGIYPSAEVIERDAMRRRAEHLRLNGGVSKPAQSEREFW
tara:strand:+ start:1152 stop:1598 length:447 start_codon:yes stop_codon:yes gene_type:complete